MNFIASFLSSVLRLFSDFFVWLGGRSSRQLQQCEDSQRIKAASLGALLLLPAIIWGAGTWAIADMMKAPPELAIPIGCISGVLVILIDRALLISLSSSQGFGFSTLFRVGIAVVGSIVFAHPPIIRFADGMIDQEIEANRSQALKSLEAQYAPQLAAVSQALRSKIDSLHASEVQAAALVATTQESLTSTRENLQHWREEADKEGAGKRAGGTGFGPRWTRIMEDQVKPLEQRELTLMTELRAASEQLTSARSATAKAIEEGSAHDPQAKQVLAEWNTARSRIEGVQHHDIFSRLAAMDQVILRRWNEGDYTLGLFYLAITLLLLGVEILAMVVKLGDKDSETALNDRSATVRIKCDAENHDKIYPIVSEQLVTKRMEHMLRKESMSMDDDFRIQALDSLLSMVGRINVKKDEVFYATDEMLRSIPSNARPEHHSFIERLAHQILDGFLHHSGQLIAASTAARTAATGYAHSAPPPPASSAPQPGPETATPPPPPFQRSSCACGIPQCAGDLCAAEKDPTAAFAHSHNGHRAAPLF